MFTKQEFGSLRISEQLFGELVEHSPAAAYFVSRLLATNETPPMFVDLAGVDAIITVHVDPALAWASYDDAIAAERLLPRLDQGKKDVDIDTLILNGRMVGQHQTTPNDLPEASTFEVTWQGLKQNELNSILLHLRQSTDSFSIEGLPHSKVFIHDVVAIDTNNID